MIRTTPYRSTHRRGMAYLLAIFVLTVLAALAMGLTHAAVSDSRQVANYSYANSARLAAESGLQFLLLHLDDVTTTTANTDPMAAVNDSLEAVLGNKAVSTSGRGLATVVTVETMTIREGQTFSAELYVASVDPSDPSAAETVQMIVTGYSGPAERRLGVTFDVRINNDILSYASVSSCRQIVRGNNTTIQGGIWSTWDRDRVVGPCNYGYDLAYPIDLGNWYWTWRNQENIRIVGNVNTHMNDQDFPHDYWYAAGHAISAADGIRHSRYMEEMKYHQQATSDEKSRWFKWQNYDTTAYRDRTEAADPTAPTGEEKVTLAYPSGNAQTFVQSGEPELADYQSADGSYLYGWQDEFRAFHTSTSATGPDGEALTRYRLEDGFLKLGETFVTNAAPDPTQPQVVIEQWENGYTFARAYYEGYDGSTAGKPTLKNVHVPQGSHAHFKDCVFEGAIYIETDENDELSQVSAADSYSKYNSALSGGVLEGEAGSASTTAACNNVVFENCTFKGPIITGVPKSFRHWQNAITIIGNTTFDSDAIKACSPDLSIMAPNFNVSVGDFNDGTDPTSNSILRGLVVGGLVEVRDNAVVRGTLLSMANLDFLSDADQWKYGAHVGNWEYDVMVREGYEPFAPSTFIDISIDMDGTSVPGMFETYYKLYPQAGSYMEYGS